MKPSDFMFMSAPHRIIVTWKKSDRPKSKMKFDGFDSSGRRAGLENRRNAIIECSSVILALVKSVWIGKRIGLELRKNASESASPVFNPYRRLCRRRCRTGRTFPKMECRHALKRRLRSMKEKRFHVVQDFQYKRSYPERKAEMVKPKIFPWKKGFKLPSLSGYSGEEAPRSYRCLRCDVKCQSGD